MSTTELPRTPQEQDHIRVRPALALIALSLAVVAVGVVWPVVYLRVRSEPPAVRARSVENDVPDVVGGLRTWQLPIAPVAPQSAGPREPVRHRELDRFAWVDRAKGIVRLPIDDAIDLWLARNAAPPPGASQGKR